MRSISVAIVVLLLGIWLIICHAQITTKRIPIDKNVGLNRCQKQKNGQRICFCGKNKATFDRLKGEKCINGQVVKKSPSSLAGLRLVTQSVHRSTRDDSKNMRCTGLLFKPRSDESRQAYVPLRNVSVEAWIDTYAADITLTQVFVNQEENPIEAIYVFPIEENAAVYSFTAQIDDRIITAELKEKKAAESEYQAAVQQGQTAVLMRQSEETLDTFTINIGALPPGKLCRVTIQYVTELELVNENSIQFVVPTTIAPRYNPSLGHLQQPDNTKTEYVQNTPYAMWFQAHIFRGEEQQISQVANLSHPVNISMSRQSIDISSQGIALDRDIILDIDLPKNRPLTLVAVEQYNDSSKHGVLLGFTPRLSDFMKISNGSEEINTEFIFIVDCSGSMTEESRISLAREAMLLFIRSLPVGSHFNIIRFGTQFDILFKDEVLTTVYNEQTAKKAENLTRSMEANFGGTELLEPLKYLKTHPPINGRSRQIFLLTDGEISNTNQVIELCRSMSSTTRIFSFGLGHSSSRSLVKGLARATNGHFVFVPPDSKVDTYVGSQFGRALQPSILNARLKWHGLSTNVSQAPKTILPLYINDRVLVYGLLEGNVLKNHNISVDLMVGEHKVSSIKLPGNIAQKRGTIRRLAAKALIQELQHEKQNTEESEDITEDTSSDSTRVQRITATSINYQILSPYTAFVGVETTGIKNNNTQSTVRQIPIQISKGDEHLFSQPTFLSRYHGNMGPMPMMSMQSRHNYLPIPARAHRFGFNSKPHGPPSSLGMSHLSDESESDDANIPQAMYDLSDLGSSSGSAAVLYDSGPSFSRPTSTSSSLLVADPVRWLIDQQSFNGVWVLVDDDIKKLTNGKSLSTFTSTVTQSKDALTTALVIAVFESKYADQKNLWYAVAAKGRKQLYSSGLNTSQVDILINEMKKNL